MNLADKVRAAGVVGAGGGGFPAHVKLSARADTVIANGAECEPLLHKDAAVMRHAAAAVVRGMLLAMDAVGAKSGIVGVKAKKKEAVEAMEQACRGTSVRVQLLGDYYPAGDEYDLVYSVTGRLIPPGGLPIQVGCVVQNVETLANIAAAAEGVPVTTKFVTLAGALHRPSTVRVPIGTSLREAIEATGGFATSDPVYSVGGLMMGEITENLDTPVTKTTAGVVVLGRDHRIIQRKLRPARAQAAIGKSACDQCRYCTEYCPRYLLGYPVEPHAVMRSLAFTATGADSWNTFAALCCSCGLCTLFACPEELYPKEACDQAKAALRTAGRTWTGPAAVKPHPLREGRRVPIKSLLRRMHLQPYDHPAPMVDLGLQPRKVTVALKQNAGAPNRSLVRPGESVRAGQPVGAVPDNALGAPIHAPFAAMVESVTERHLTLAR